MPDSEGPAKPQMVEFGNDSFPRSQREAEKFWENVSFTADLPSRPKHRSQRHGNHQSSRAASRSLTPKTTPDISLRSSGTPVVKLPPPIHSKTQEDPFSTTELLGGRGLNQSQSPHWQPPRKTLDHSESENFLKLHHHESHGNAANPPNDMASRPSARALLRHSSAPPPPVPYASKPVMHSPGLIPEVPRAKTAVPEARPETPLSSPMTSTVRPPLTPTHAPKGKAPTPEAPSGELAALEGLNSADSPCASRSEVNLSIWSKCGAKTQGLAHPISRVLSIWSALELDLSKTDAGEPRYIYAFKVPGPDYEGFVKIGVTENLPERLGHHIRCYRKCIFVYNMDINNPQETKHAKRVERLIHTELAPWAYDIQKCPAERCKGAHTEWFKISTETATAVIEKWINFMNKADLYRNVDVESVDEEDKKAIEGDNLETPAKGKARQDTPTSQSKKSKSPNAKDQGKGVWRPNPSFKFDETATIEVPAVLVPYGDFLGVKLAR